MNNIPYKLTIEEMFEHQLQDIATEAERIAPTLITINNEMWHELDDTPLATDRFIITIGDKLFLMQKLRDEDVIKTYRLMEHELP